MAVKTMKQAGWVWEGLGFDPGVEPSVYGVGEGIRYFGLEGATLIFHQNNPVNLAKLSHARRVTADISKWVWLETKAEKGRFAFAQRRNDSPDNVSREARNVSDLSRQFRNISGGFIDDTHGVAAHADYTSDSPRKIKEALCEANPNLELEIVVYTHELQDQYWKDWLDVVDVVSLWVWESKNLPNIDDYIAQFRVAFPKQRINMGIYIRDYSIPAPVALDMLEVEMDGIRRHLDTGNIDGYSILGACLIDQHPEQAEFLRSYIQNH